MNREMRRRFLQQHGGPIDTTPKPLTIQYGHDETGAVVMVFSQPISNLRLADGQIDDLIAKLQDTRAKAAAVRPANAA